MDEDTDAALMAAGHKMVAMQDELDSLRRWKSTHAPRLEALQGLLETAQREAAEGTEARASLASEREANAILTAEVEQLRAQAQRYRDQACRSVNELEFGA
jgi:hypothetical protein